MIQRITKMTYLTDIGLLLLMIMTATFINPNWAVAPLEILPISGIYNDHWVYTGIMLDMADKFEFVIPLYSNHPLIQENGYIFERFSWSVPGTLLYHLFSPLIANYLLKLGVYALSIMGIYWALRHLFGRRTGLFGALALGGYAWFLRSAGWEYVDGVGIGYFLMSFALIIAATHAHQKTTWRILCVLVGIMLVNLATSNLYWGFLTPHVALVALWLNHRLHKRSIIQSLAFFLFGAGIMVFIYGAISYHFRGEWFFLTSSLQSVQDFSEGNWNIWREINTDVYGPMTPHYHVLPIVTLLVSIIPLLRGKASVYYPHQRLLIAQLVWMYGILAINHHIFIPSPYLIIVLYSSYIIAPLFLVIGALVAPAIESLTAKQFRTMLAGILMLFIMPFALSIIIPVTEKWQNNPFILIVCVSMIIIALLPLPKQRLLIAFAGIVLFGWMSSSQIYVFRSDRLLSQEQFLMAIDTYEQIEAHYTSNGIRDFHFIQDDRIITNLPIPVASMFYINTYYMGRQTTMQEDEMSVTLNSQAFVALSHGQDTQKTVVITRYPQTFDRLVDQYFIDTDYMLDDSITIARYGMSFNIYFMSIGATQDIFAEKSTLRYRFDPVEPEPAVILSHFDGVEMANRRYYRWMIAPQASLQVDVPADHFDPDLTYQFTVNTSASLEEDVLNSLQIVVNDMPIALTRIGTYFEGQIAGETLNQSTLEIIFKTNRTTNPADLGYNDSRQLAVALELLTITPIIP